MVGFRQGRPSPLAGFDPNVKHKPLPPRWATYIPDRSTGPSFKLHKNIGHAKNAFHEKRDAILYEWSFIRNAWVELARIEDFPRRPNCPTGCGNTTYSFGWSGEYDLRLGKPNTLRFEPKPCYRCANV